MSLALPLLFSSAGCRSPRVITLKSLQAPIAFLLPASTAAPSESPAASDPADLPRPPGTQPSASESLSGGPPVAVPEPSGPLGLASHLEPIQDLSQGPLRASSPGTSQSSDPATATASTIASDNPGPLTDGAGEQTLPQRLGGLPQRGIQPEAVAAVEAAVEAGAADQLDSLGLQDVLISATQSYPAVREASLLRNVAIGNQIAALGEFDDRLEAFTINQPLGYYENYRHGLGWKKPRWQGGSTYAGYRLGDGDFEPWYGERETDEGGEFKAGFEIPLLQNRAIDARRTALRMATLDIQKASPELFQQVLITQYQAASAYWSWSAAAKQYQIALELMRLAEQRVDRIEQLIAAGDLAAVVGIDNRRLLALRRERLIEAQQKLDTAAIKLSLYYRDALGRPILPSADQQPPEFPLLPGGAIDVSAEVTRALTNRPELQILQVSDEQLRTELRLAINQRLPEVSFSSEVSQDVGGLTSSKGDKQPFKLEAGLVGSVPVQRRKAIGKAQALRAKLAQLDAKRQLTSDRISNEVRQAVTIYDAAIARLEQAQITRQLAQQTLQAGEVSFAAGDIDILQLNIYEQAFADAGSDIILAQADLLIAQAMLMTATGRSLLDTEIERPIEAELP